MTAKTRMPMASGSQAPWRSLRLAEEKKTASIAAKKPNSGAAMYQRQCQTRVAITIIASEVTSMTPDTAKPYAAARRELEPKLTTRKTQDTSSARLITGT